MKNKLTRDMEKEPVRPARRVPQAAPVPDKELREKIGGVKEVERRRKHRLRKILMIMIPADLVVVVALLVLQFARIAGGYTVEGTAYRYYAGNKAQMADGTHLSLQADGTTWMDGAGVEGSLTSLPIYYEDRQTVVIPSSMVYYESGSSLAQRAECFTELNYLENGAVTAVHGGKETSLSRGFLFDGEDTYIFLEPVTLSFDGYEIDLGIMSYVIADYRNNMMIYNRSDGSMSMEVPDGPATAAAESGNYVLSLYNDSLTLHDGSKVLLFTRPDLLEGLM